MDNEKRTERDDLIIGRNAVSEALKSGRAIDTLLVARGERNGSIGQILAKCRDLGIVIKEVDRKSLIRFAILRPIRALPLMPLLTNMQAWTMFLHSPRRGAKSLSL